MSPHQHFDSAWFKVEFQKIRVELVLVFVEAHENASATSVKCFRIQDPMDPIT